MLQQYRAYSTDVDDGWDVLLLEDIRDIFAELDKDKIHTTEILNKLHLMLERPWPEFPNRKTGETKPMTSRKLANLLKPHEIRSKQMKLDDVNKHGYERSDFEDTWIRYVSTPPEKLSAPAPENPSPSATPLPSAENKGSRGSGKAEVAATKGNGLAEVAATDSQPLPPQPYETAKGSGVAGRTPPEGGLGEKTYVPDVACLEDDPQEREAIENEPDPLEIPPMFDRRSGSTAPENT